MSKHHDHHDHHDHRCYGRRIIEPVPPWSDTHQEPDAQWTPVIPVNRPLRFVDVPFYCSSEDPAPEWAPNVPIRPFWSTDLPMGHRHHHHDHDHDDHHHHHENFLRSHWKDDVLGYIYGRNPFSNTVNAGGYHFQ